MTASPKSFEQISPMTYTYSVSNSHSLAWWAATPELCHDSEKTKIKEENMSNANRQPENITVSEWAKTGAAWQHPRQSTSHSSSAISINRQWAQTLPVRPRLAASDRRVCEREDGPAFNPKCLMAAVDPCVYTGLFHLAVFVFTKVRSYYTTLYSWYTII